jgi:hypothetical protein
MLLLWGVLWWLVACVYGLGFKMESCGGFDLQKGRPWFALIKGV